MREDIRALPESSGIYAIEHVSGNVYIGSSKNVRARCGTHVKELRRGTHHCHHLRYAWRKYGPDEFTFKFVETCLPDDVILVAREQVWIDKHRGHLYNSKKFAEGFSRAWWQTDEGKAARRRIVELLRRWRESQPEVELVCQFCGNTFKTRTAYKSPRFCSRNCIQRRRVSLGKADRPRDCVVCGKEFVSRCNRSRTCSADCKRESRSRVFAERAARRPITAGEIPSILACLAGGQPTRRIARRYGVTRHAIVNIGRRKTWADVPVPPEIEEALSLRFSIKRRYIWEGQKLTESQVLRIKQLIGAGAVQAEVAKAFGVSVQMVNGIRKGRTYADIRLEDHPGIPPVATDALAPFLPKPESKEAREARGRRAASWWAARDGAEFTCVVCGERFLCRHPMGASYCSDECYRKEAIATNKFKEERICPQCGTTFMTKRGSPPSKRCSSACGKKHGSRINPDVVRDILRRVAAGESMRALSREHGIDLASVQGIAKRERWSEVAVEPEIEEALRSRFSRKFAPPMVGVRRDGAKYSIRKLDGDQVREIKRLLASGEMQQKEIARRFGISECMVSGIKRGKQYADVPHEPPAPLPLFPDA